MSGTRPNRIDIPSRRSFGVSDSALDDNESLGVPSPSPARRVLGRISFSQSLHRRSFMSRWRETADEEHGKLGISTSERPPIPSALQGPGESYTTPLPVLSMVVLSITMLGEFLSANVSTPFLLFMVKGFGNFTDKADIAFWTGILVSTFFMTQFLTSLLWATVAEKHGQRAVLFVSLLGSAVTCLIFGTSTTLQQAITIRLLQGIFAGAVGVARGCVTVVTDPSNEGRAYAILGFCWGFGGVAGAIIGGTFETPAEKWPNVFNEYPLFIKYPYLLPCALAGLITFIGSILSLFLGRDGGPREGAIRLHEKLGAEHPTIPEEPETPDPFIEESRSHSRLGSLRKKVSQKLSGYFASRVHNAHAESVSPLRSNEHPVPLSSPTQRERADKQRTFSHTSRADGSAYGYSGSYRNRLASATSLRTRRGSNVSSMRRRRGSNADGTPASVTEGGDLNFAQRLLMANENAVTNIADLWVAAAMNVDNDDPFESDTELESDGVPEGFSPDEDEEDIAGTSSTPTRRGRSIPGGPSNNLPRTSLSSRPSNIAIRQSFGSPRQASALRGGVPSSSVRRVSSSQGITADEVSSPRRPSFNVPSIFAHPGVRSPPAVVDAQQLLTRSDERDGDVLTSIREHHRLSDPQPSPPESPQEKPPSLTSQLPIPIIIQYGLLALHSTTHDQVFLSYLVSDYEGGGLNLNAGHFAQLIALMCLAQIAYQFYLYPNIGPPRGRFSHLAMFRVGSLLFIPSYLSVIPYRVFASASDDGNFILMSALAMSTALRYCGITFSYTAIAILLNYMSPPNVVGYANGVAQSIVSLARCLGPVLGGYLWSVSVEKDPSGYPLGFLACAGVCAFAVLSSYLIR